MRKVICLFVLFIWVNQLFSQNQEKYIKFTYDNAGNRLSRNVIILESPEQKSTQDTSQFTPLEQIQELAKIEASYNYENLDGAKIKIFPNPTQGFLMLRIENYSNTEQLTIHVYNSTGSLLQTKIPDSNSMEIDMSSYTSGLYFLKIIKQDQKLEYKIIKN